MGAPFRHYYGSVAAFFRHEFLLELNRNRAYEIEKKK